MTGFRSNVVIIRHFRHTGHMAGARETNARVSAMRMGAAVIAVGALLLGLLTAPAAAAVPTGVQTAASSVSTGIVQAADLSQFRAGNIVSDAVFFNRSTMTESQIQSFLNAKVPSCRSGYTCLKSYYDTSRTTSADAMCGKYSGGVRERASRIIFKVAQACGINPQVLLVMLQKEQGLVTSTAPSSYAYRAAMGQGCPDTAACDTRYYGFFNQVYGGAWQLKRYANPPGTSQFFTWYAPGKTWDVLYHPNRGCGTSRVTIQNQATANLYYYTPYQPNAAALRAGYGTGDSCSSYGNRNFYNYFSDWFGSLQTTDPCVPPSGTSAASKVYVVTVDVATARVAPSRECTKSTEPLARGAVVQAIAVTADSEWIKVNVETRDLWVLRSSVDYATSAQAACVLPSSDAASRTYVVSTASTARAQPSTSCSTGTASVAAGTVVTAVAGTADRDWLKVGLVEGELWVPRTALRYASADESLCALPAGIAPAQREYILGPGGADGRIAPSAACADPLDVPAGTVFQAVAGTADRNWLMYESSGGSRIWVPRADADYLSQMDPCALGGEIVSAKRTYAVTTDAVVGRSEPSVSCDTASSSISAGTVATAVEATAEKDWVRLAVGREKVWVQRNDVRYATTEEAVCAPPVSTIDAKLGYVVKPGGAVVRSAPSTSCATGSATLLAGTRLTAIAATTSRDWLMFETEPGSARWVPRSAVTYATSTDVCDLGAAVVSAQRTYVLTADLSARSHPSASCEIGAVDVSAGTAAKAVAATADKQWLKLAFATGHKWVPRTHLRYATSAEAACALPTSLLAATRSYVVEASGATGRSAPSLSCSQGVEALAAGTAFTAVWATAARDWLMFTTPDNRSVWVPRGDVTYR